MKGKLIASLIGAALVVGVAGGYLGAGARPQLGLDLKGGISAILSPAENEEVDTDVLDETIEVIRRRVDSLGVAEPEIARQGQNVLVQLPGLQDEERAREVIGRTAKLTFRPVEQVIQPGTAAYDESPPCGELPELADDEGGILCGGAESAVPVFDDSGQPRVDEETGEQVERRVKYQVGPAALDGSTVGDAFVQVGAQQQTGDGGNFSVQLDLDSEGARQFQEITADLACQRDQGQPGQLAIVLDNVVESAPGMQASVRCGEGIPGGTATITTGGGEQDARDLALVLRTGALPITLVPSTFETVSPTLGQESLDAGLLAGVVGLALVTLYLVGFYRWLGAVAVGALVIFGVVIVGLITVAGEIGFTLTLAGIAGVIVSIGITADSSIIYFERLRDEVGSGRTMRTATQRAFKSAFRTNLTGNTTTLAAALILWFIAVGPVRGFAATLGIATVLDIAILYVYTRPAVQLLGRTRLLTAGSIRARRREPAIVGGAE